MCFRNSCGCCHCQHQSRPESHCRPEPHRCRPEPECRPEPPRCCRPEPPKCKQECSCRQESRCRHQSCGICGFIVALTAVSCFRSCGNRHSCDRRD